jgi:hypothetical protein
MPGTPESAPNWFPSGGVVVDDVEDDLDPRLVKSTDHRLELQDLLTEPAGKL